MSTLFDVDEVLDTVIHGDALEVLKTLPDNCVDAIVCDPPSSINFMNKSWDSDKGGRTQWVAWLASIMSEAKRCLRPGGHALVWALPRTSHWTALALEDAGFEIRDQIYNLVSGDTALYNFFSSLNEEQQHAFMQVLDAQREPSGIMQIFGSGFPKSLSVDKAIDRHFNAERTEGMREWKGGQRSNGILGNNHGTQKLVKFDTPATEAAKQYSGYGTHLKPSVENWWLVRKPLAAHSIAENVLEYGTGAINIDASRVGWDKESLDLDTKRRQSALTDIRGGSYGKAAGAIAGGYQGDATSPQGRFPSHLLLSHTLFCQQSGTKRVQANGPSPQEIQRLDGVVYSLDTFHNSPISYRDEDGMETVTNWICDESCPVKILDEQVAGTRTEKPSASGMGGLGDQYVGAQNWKPFRSTRYTDSGGASRYFQQFPALDDVPPYIYAGKASRKDRTADNTVNNTHPTVKNISMLRYFVRLLCPPNGIVLDMFGGSGSTGVACIHEGFHYILVEKELEYITIARSRIEHAIATVGAKPQPPPATKPPALLRPRHKTTTGQPTLWDKEISI